MYKVEHRHSYIYGGQYSTHTTTHKLEHTTYSTQELHETRSFSQ